MKRILAVDDDPTILTLETKVLSQEGYEVITASDGESAMQLLKEQDFDLVLLDIMMPGIDGFEVSRTFRDDKQKRKVPVVFISARDDAAAYKEGFRSGGTMFLAKPFTAVQLSRVVRSMIRE